jgi:hypothetical protein
MPCVRAISAFASPKHGLFRIQFNLETISAQWLHRHLDSANTVPDAVSEDQRQQPGLVAYVLLAKARLQLGTGDGKSSRPVVWCIVVRLGLSGLDSRALTHQV